MPWSDWSAGPPSQWHFQNSSRILTKVIFLVLIYTDRKFFSGKTKHFCAFCIKQYIFAIGYCCIQSLCDTVHNRHNRHLQQWIESVNRINEPNQWIESMNRISESNQWIESVNRINESNPLTELVTRINESNQWIESINRISESNQWIESMNRINEANQWIESMNRVNESNQWTHTIDTYNRHSVHYTHEVTF